GQARSAGEILDRYEGAEVCAPGPAAGEVAKRVPVTGSFADGDILAGGVEAIAMHHMDEAAFRLPGHHAVLFGDSVLGYEGRVALSPASWLRDGESPEKVEASVRRALEPEPELLLLTHGGPRPRAQLQL